MGTGIFDGNMAVAVACVVVAGGGGQMWKVESMVEIWYFL